MPDVTNGFSVVPARSSGYVQLRDDKLLLRFAQENNIVIQLLFQTGDFVVKGVPLAKVWPDQPWSDERDASVNEAFILGHQRTLVQDVTFGINDPFTAMTCLDWLGTALSQISTRILPAPEVFDDKGYLRLIRVPVTFTSLLDAAFNQIREYGRTSTAVSLRMMDTIAAIAQCVHTEKQRQALLHHAMLVERGSQSGLPEKADQELIAHRYQDILKILKAQ